MKRSETSDKINWLGRSWTLEAEVSDVLTNDGILTQVYLDKSKKWELEIEHRKVNSRGVWYDAGRGWRAMLMNTEPSAKQTTYSVSVVRKTRKSALSALEKLVRAPLGKVIAQPQNLWG